MRLQIEELIMLVRSIRDHDRSGKSHADLAIVLIRLNILLRKLGG